MAMPMPWHGHGMEWAWPRPCPWPWPWPWHGHGPWPCPCHGHAMAMPWPWHGHGPWAMAMGHDTIICLNYRHSVQLARDSRGIGITMEGTAVPVVYRGGWMDVVSVGVAVAMVLVQWAAVRVLQHYHSQCSGRWTVSTQYSVVGLLLDTSIITQHASLCIISYTF